MVANALTGVRLAVTAPFLAACAAAVPDASRAIRIVPLLLFAVAAATDLLDGWAARRKGTASKIGQLLDHTTDVIFLGSSLVFFAATGRISWLVPTAVAVSVGAYARDLWRDVRATVDLQVTRSGVGHVAGVVNYLLVGLLAADLTLAGAAPEWLMHTAAGSTVGINALAGVGRLWRVSRTDPV